MLQKELQISQIQFILKDNPSLSSFFDTILNDNQEQKQEIQMLKSENGKLKDLIVKLNERFVGLEPEKKPLEHQSSNHTYTLSTTKIINPPSHHQGRPSMALEPFSPRLRKTSPPVTPSRRSPLTSSRERSKSTPASSVTCSPYDSTENFETYMSTSTEMLSGATYLTPISPDRTGTNFSPTKKMFCGNTSPTNVPKMSIAALLPDRKKSSIWVPPDKVVYTIKNVNKQTMNRANDDGAH
ncbi:cell cycle protein GpsB [Acrasis kona]|uniref:Cell cycle protein GpsB n=1 Tax=Acrasis kona TaxID=1008807 RepID=A0AAW2YLI0_9EUKA